MMIHNLHAQTDAAKADSFRNVNRYDEALKLYEKILKTDIANGNDKKIGKDYNNIANIYIDIGDYKKSTDYYFKALRLIEQYNDKAALASNYYNIASNYYTIGKENYSVDYLNKAISILKDLQNNELTLAYCFNLLSAIKIDNKKYNEAFTYAKKAEGLFKTLKQNDQLAKVYTTISCLAIEQKNYKLALEYNRKSFNLYKEQNDIAGIATSYVNLYKINFNPYDTGISLNKNEALKAIAFLDSAKFVLEDIHIPEIETKIYEDKQYIYSRLKQFDSAFIYQEKFWQLNDSLHNVEKNKQLEELKVAYEVEKKEQENALLQKTSQNAFYLIIILSISIIAIALIALLFIRLNKLRNRQKTLLLEQKLLRLQMNPHFLFNAINGIQKYILKKDKQEAYDYLAKFARLIRIILNNSQEKTLVLHQELEMIKLYIELEQLRFNNAFEFILKISEDLNEYETAVPTMLIQPYIENAIWHGLMNLDNERKGILKVSIEIKDTILKIVIEDNGIGRERAKSYRKEENHRSLGMKLTEERLLLINKMDDYEHAKVLINDVLDEQKNICGTRVEIFIQANGK